MAITRLSPCKINLLLNVLGRRPDGYHELETILQPIPLHDRIEIERGAPGVRLTCNHPGLPTDAGNLVYRAAALFLETTGISDGVRLHLDKQTPLESGLGGGSGNAATTLTGLNELFGAPLSADRLQALAAQLGSDVPFFLQPHPALATGRGEIIEPLGPLAALTGRWLLLAHPGFGVPTAWAYKQLVGFPSAVQGRPGRARGLIELLRGPRLEDAAPGFYNALEGPVHTKYPLLMMYQEYLRQQGATVALMSGSGSATYGILPSEAEARRLETGFKSEFGQTCWTAVVPLAA